MLPKVGGAGASGFCALVGRSLTDCSNDVDIAKSFAGSSVGGFSTRFVDFFSFPSCDPSVFALKGSPGPLRVSGDGFFAASACCCCAVEPPAVFFAVEEDEDEAEEENVFDE